MDYRPMSEPNKYRFYFGSRRLYWRIRNRLIRQMLALGYHLYDPVDAFLN